MTEAKAIRNSVEAPTMWGEDEPVLRAGEAELALAAECLKDAPALIPMVDVLSAYGIA